MIEEFDALIVVDVQNDFCPGGALPVPNGDEIIPILNRYITAFNKASKPIIYSMDYHPENHCSFKENGGVWPTHCVHKTKGIRLHPDLFVPKQRSFEKRTMFIYKGDNPSKEAYSAFEGQTIYDETLAYLLQEKGVINVLIGGLATDYCVKSTVLDALRLGFDVTLLIDGCRGVGDNVATAIGEMILAGAKIR